MPGLINKNWSPWPQLTFATAKGVQSGNEEYTKAILRTYGAEALKRSWIQVCKRLKSVTDRIVLHGNSVLPELGLEDFLNADAETKNILKDTGCFIVRQVVTEQQATKWYHELKGYVENNKAQITGIWIVHLVDVSSLTISRVVQACQPRTHSCSMSTIRQSNKLLALIQTALRSNGQSTVYGMIVANSRTTSKNPSPMPTAFASALRIPSSMHYLHTLVGVSLYN